MERIKIYTQTHIQYIYLNKIQTFNLGDVKQIEKHLFVHKVITSRNSNEIKIC